MTTEELKRAFDICLDTHGCTDCPLLALEQQNGCGCKHNLFVSAIDLTTEQEREIEQLKEEKKQAQIEILSKSKKRIKTAIDTYFNLDGGGYYLAEDAINDIDDLIEEVEKQ